MHWMFNVLEGAFICAALLLVKSQKNKRIRFTLMVLIIVISIFLLVINNKS